MLRVWLEMWAFVDAALHFDVDVFLVCILASCGCGVDVYVMVMRHVTAPFAMFDLLYLSVHLFRGGVLVVGVLAWMCVVAPPYTPPHFLLISVQSFKMRLRSHDHAHKTMITWQYYTSHEQVIFGAIIAPPCSLCYPHALL